MNVPKLRFKEFNDEYNALKLSDVAELTSSKRIYLSDYTDNGIPFYRGKEISELKLNKPVSDLLYISDEKYKEIEAKYGVPKENDILVTGVGTLGNIYRIPNNNKFYFKDGNLIWLKNIKQNSEYLEYNLEFNKKKLLDSAIGSTQKALTIAGLNKLSFYYPSTSEQTKVARTMQLIDIKINLQSKKIEDLKLFKKGLIYNEKRNNNSWNEYKISDIMNITRGTVIPKTEISECINNEFKYPVYSSQTSNNGILGYDNKYDFNGKFLTWTTDGANAGKVFYREGKFRCTNVCGILYNKDNRYVSELTAELLNIETPKYVSYVGNPKLMNNVMSNIIIKLPDPSRDYFFSSILKIINKKLTIEEEKFDKLFELKKGLMQNMFV